MNRPFTPQQERDYIASLSDREGIFLAEADGRVADLLRLLVQRAAHGQAGRFPDRLLQTTLAHVMAADHPPSLSSPCHPARRCFDRPSTGLALGEINVFDAQAHTFHQPQAAAVEQFRHQLVRPR